MNSYLESIFGMGGKTVVITGGSGVLGFAIAKAFVNAGAARVVITSRTLDKAQSRAAELKGDTSVDVIGLACEAGDDRNVAAFIASLDEHGIDKVHCLVNGAGGNNAKGTVTPSQTVTDIAVTELVALMDQNLFSAIRVTNGLLHRLCAAGKSSIINIGSMAAILPLSRVVAYSASKAALHNYTKWLASELARKKAQYGNAEVRVNAIAPGFFLGDQNRGMLIEPDKATLPIPECLTARGKAIIEQTPMARFGEPDELIGAALLLAGPAGSFINGEVICVDGAYSAHKV